MTLIGAFIWNVCAFLPQFSPRGEPPQVRHRARKTIYQERQSQLQSLPIQTLNNLDRWQQDENLDDILKDLVSPAPESFLVINATVAKLNLSDEDNHDVRSYMLDLDSLSKSLVKSGRLLHVYREEHHSWKWKIRAKSDHENDTNMNCMDYDNTIMMEKPHSQLYHNYTTLELAHLMATAAAEGQSGAPKSNTFSVEHVVFQMEQRLKMTLGSDLRGRTSADAAFQLALSGVKQHAHIFEAIIKIGTHELMRTGGRSSFKSKYILQMVEKFAASGVVTVSMFELYDKAGECLERKGFPDEELIASLRNGSFGLHSDRPLLWLWRFSARQKKIALDDSSKTCNRIDVSWNDYFADTAKGLVVDIGCGLGVSLLNLSAASSQPKHVGVMESTDLANMNMKWDENNYVGVDLNSKLINYAQGVISRRDEACQKRVEFVCCPALELLSYLKSYPGKIELLTINFPSPFRLHTVNGLNLNGNSQLPQSYKDGFMITDEMAIQIAHILHKSMGVLVFQTKCEDVAVYTKNLLLGTGSLECVPCIVPVLDVNERYYDNGGSAPKRVQEWLKCNLDTERAEGECWSSIPLMPLFGRPETEVSCEFQNTVVHRCLFRSIH